MSMRLLNDIMAPMDRTPQELSFPYTWSNRNAPLSAVLAGALLRPRLADLVRLSLHYGHESLQQAFIALVAAKRLRGGTEKEVERILNNVRIGVERHRAKAH